MVTDYRSPAHRKLCKGQMKMRLTNVAKSRGAYFHLPGLLRDILALGWKNSPKARHSSVNSAISGKDCGLCLCTGHTAVPDPHFFRTHESFRARLHSLLGSSWLTVASADPLGQIFSSSPYGEGGKWRSCLVRVYTEDCRSLGTQQSIGWKHFTGNCYGFTREVELRISEYSTEFMLLWIIELLVIVLCTHRKV